VRSEVASGGIFHITFERDSPVQLLRVLVDGDLGVYPEISGSHYRSSVRFVVWNGLMDRPRQTDTDVPFEIVCCS
jgi:cell division protein ZapD